MRLQSLTLAQVRNLAPLDLVPGPRFNVFAGDNGQGKTNLLESIYAVCTLRSFRTRRLTDLIAFGASSARLAAQVERGGSLRTYELIVPESGPRRVRLDDKAVRPASRYFGGFQVVLFAPEDLAVPRGAPADRRAFLDRAVFQRTPEYLTLAQSYDKVLKSRNALLKNLRERGGGAGRGAGGGAPLLEVYDQQLAELGARRIVLRHRFVSELEPRFRAAFEAIGRADKQPGLRYACRLREAPDAGALADQAEMTRRLAAALERARAVNLARATTTVGPHRDDLEITLDGRDAAAFASQGQLRALVLAWKTAELDLLTEAHGEAPILLLDDVSSELDPRRNEYLFEFLGSKRAQCFITTTHPSYVLTGPERVDYDVRSGTVKRQNSE